MLAIAYSMIPACWVEIACWRLVLDFAGTLAICVQSVGHLGVFSHRQPGKLNFADSAGCSGRSVRNGHSDFACQVC